MKQILTFFLVAFSTLAVAQDKDAEFIGGENTFYGTVTDREVTIDYRAKVKYSATLFGGIKVNANITEFVFWNVRYKGKKMSNAVYEELGIDDKDGYIKPDKRSTIDFTTDVRFYTTLMNDYNVYDVKFVAVGWGTLDEYTYLKPNMGTQLQQTFNITANNIKDFYKLNMSFRDLQITHSTMSIIREIKNAMDKETADEKELERKLEALQKLRDNGALTLSQLNQKVSLLNDVIETGYTDCYGYQTCYRALAKAQEEIEEGKKKGEKEDKAEEEKEAVAEKKEERKDNDKNTEEQQRLAQEQKRKQAEAQRKVAEAERKRKEEAKRKAEEERRRLENLKLIKFQDDNGKYGFKDEAGNVIISPKYSRVGKFSEGLAYFEIYNRERDITKRGYMNKNQLTVINLDRNVWDGCKFNDGKAVIVVNTRKSRMVHTLMGKMETPIIRCLQIDKTGNIIKTMGETFDKKHKYYSDYCRLCSDEFE